MDLAVGIKPELFIRGSQKEMSTEETSHADCKLFHSNLIKNCSPACLQISCKSSAGTNNTWNRFRLWKLCHDIQEDCKGHIESIKLSFTDVDLTEKKKSVSTLMRN
jgi:hypothetical protein